MTFIVKHATTGLFLSLFGKWRAEYPDAQEFGSLRQAKAAAQKTKVICEIWEDYGLEDEHIALVVSPEDP